MYSLAADSGKAFEIVRTLSGIQNKFIPTGNTSKEEGLVSTEGLAFKFWINVLS